MLARVPVLAGRDFNSESEAGQESALGLLAQSRNVPFGKRQAAEELEMTCVDQI